MFEPQHCPQCNSIRPPGAASCRVCGLSFASTQQPHSQARSTRQSGSAGTLVLKVLAELPPQDFEISGTSADIGRLPEANVTLGHRSVSRQHARISPSGGGYVVEDLGSKNGTWLNDQPVTGPTPLRAGDTLLVGDVPLQVELVGVEETAPDITPVTPVTRVPVPQDNWTPAPPPPPLPAPPAHAGLGPSTVMIDVDDALAATPPPNVMPAPAWDDTPVTSPPFSVSELLLEVDADDHPTVFQPMPAVPEAQAGAPAPEPVAAHAPITSPLAAPAPLEPAAVSMVQMALCSNMV
jgi:predicted component of type VI protein secretion system